MPASVLFLRFTERTSETNKLKDTKMERMCSALLGQVFPHTVQRLIGSVGSVPSRQQGQGHRTKLHLGMNVQFCFHLT